MTVSLSHFEIRVRDLPKIEDFYTRGLGFVVTDRGDAGMVFLSLNPGEHHQIVLSQATAGEFSAGTLDHLAFRVGSLGELRGLHRRLEAAGAEGIETVSHGTTWSVYFRDPEGNRLEFFVDTPWHVAQPLRFAIDLAMADDALAAWTEEKIKTLAGFRPVERWRDDHLKQLAPKDPPGRT